MGGKTHVMARLLSSLAPRGEEYCQQEVDRSGLSSATVRSWLDEWLPAMEEEVATEIEAADETTRKLLKYTLEKLTSPELGPLMLSETENALIKL